MNNRRRRRDAQADAGEDSTWEDWTIEDLEALDDPCLDSLEMEIGLPLRAENYVTGEPLVTVDYFGFEKRQRASIEKRLLDLEDALVDEGACAVRVLLFDRPDTSNVRDLIAILTVRENDLRVETARSDVTDRIHRTVASALGAGARHLRRTLENPIDAYLHG